MIYIETPVSEKPETSGYYFAWEETGFEEWPVMGGHYYFDKDTSLWKDGNKVIKIISWLRPITVNGGLSDEQIINKAAQHESDFWHKQGNERASYHYLAGMKDCRTHYESLLASKEAEAVERVRQLELDHEREITQMAAQFKDLQKQLFGAEQEIKDLLRGGGPMDGRY